MKSYLGSVNFCGLIFVKTTGNLIAARANLTLKDKQIPGPRNAKREMFVVNQLPLSFGTRRKQIGRSYR